MAVNWFSYFINTIFPSLGEFFGVLTSFSSTSIYNILGLFQTNEYAVGSLMCTNLYTGESFLFLNVAQQLPWAVGIVVNSISVFAEGIFRALGVSSIQPAWLALITSAVNVFLVMAIIRWVRSFF